MHPHTHVRTIRREKGGATTIMERVQPWWVQWTRKAPRCMDPVSMAISRRQHDTCRLPVLVTR